MRIVSVERGHDPRDFTLVPFGGAGPLHGCALAELLDIRRVLITPAPGVLCADGLLAADLRSEFSRAMAFAGAMDPAATAPIIAELEQQASDWLDIEDVKPDARLIERKALLRYAGQGGEIAVDYASDRATVEDNFRTAHKALYGFNLGAPIELVTLRVHATGVAASPPVVNLEPGETPAPDENTGVSIGGLVRDVPVHRSRQTGGRGDLHRTADPHPARHHDLCGARLARAGASVRRHPADAERAMTSASLVPVFEHIGARDDEYVARLIDYVRNPSISAHNIGIREVSELLVKMLGDLGLEVEAIPTRGHPFVPGTLHGRSGQADRAALRPLRRAAARSARTVGKPAVRADHSQRPHLCPRRRRQQGPAFRADHGHRGPSCGAWHRCPAT